jgi:hypothetical protein
MSENPDMQPIEVMKKIENLWLNMPHTQKKKYNKGESHDLSKKMK